MGKIKLHQLLHIVIIFAIVLCIACKTKDQSKDKSSKEYNYDIYLLIGQSNMAGRGAIESPDKDTLDHVLLYRGDSTVIWEKAANPLNKYSTVRKELSMQKLGPGYTFAKRMEELYPKRTIGLVVNARGGSSLVEWVPGGKLYSEALKRAKDASKWGTIRGVLWHQGESNVNHPSLYLDDLAVFIKTLRKDLNNPTLPFIVGQIYTSSNKSKTFNECLLKVPNLIPNTAVVLSDSTTSLEDHLHFDAKSQRLVGNRYADQMYKMLKVQ